MMPGAPAAIDTFRDPAGSLRIEGDLVRRRVRAALAQPALRFLRSPLAQEWVKQGHLVATLEQDSPEASEVFLEHPRIFFSSYPWEWTPNAWIAAANLTLDLCERLLKEGLVLKDATPLNVLFEGTRPVLVDVLSIDARDPESPIWLAYAQFVRTFLLPLLAYRYLGWPLTASLIRRDGYEPADIYPYLGPMQRWREPFRSLVTLPHLFERRGQAMATAPTAKLRQKPEVAAAVLGRNLQKLRTKVAALKPADRDSRWSRYSETADHYSGKDHEQKQAFVRNSLLKTRPQRVLDLGANTGVYSRIAAETGARVVGWDTDVAASMRSWSFAAEQKLDIQPLIADPARPSPATGWLNREWLSLLDRTRERFDCVFMLGLMHHLLIADQIPLSEVVELLRALTTQWAITEWIPATDPRFKELVRGRDDLYGHLDRAAFVLAARKHFAIVEEERLENGRTLFLLKAQ